MLVGFCRTQSWSWSTIECPSHCVVWGSCIVNVPLAVTDALLPTSGLRNVNALSADPSLILTIWCNAWQIILSNNRTLAAPKTTALYFHWRLVDHCGSPPRATKTKTKAIFSLRTSMPPIYYQWTVSFLLLIIILLFRVIVFYSWHLLIMEWLF